MRTPVAVDDALRPPEARAVHDDAEGGSSGGLVDRGLHLVGVGHVGRHELGASPKLLGERFGPRLVAVDDRHDCTAGGEAPHCRLAQPRRPSGDERPCLFDLHPRNLGQPLELIRGRHPSNGRI